MTTPDLYPIVLTDTDRITHMQKPEEQAEQRWYVFSTHRDRERDARLEGGTAAEEASGRIQAVRSAEANQLTG